MNLQKVKERVSKYKEEIDEAEERELTATTALVEAESRAELTLAEVDGIRRRLVLLQKDLDVTNERLAKTEAKLNHAESRHIDNESRRLEFEAEESERDEKLLVVEEECVTAKKIGDEAHYVLVESERKLVIVESDLQRANDRLNVISLHVESLESRISDAAGEIRRLEDLDDEAAQREQLSAEKLEFLFEQLRLAVETSESGEREARKLEELIASMHHEVSGWALKTGSVREESTEIENLADELFDQAGACRAPPPRKFEPEREYEPAPEAEPEAEDEAEPEPQPGAEEDD